MSASGDPPIIINGGSVTLDFDSNQLKPSGNGKHHHPDKKLSHIIIKGDGLDIDKALPTGKVTITIFYEDTKKP